MDTQEELRRLYELAQAFQEGFEGHYMYGQECSDSETSQEGLEQSNGQHLTMR